MRYYIYVSATKVEQLFAQIPQQLVKRLVTKLTVDLKVVKAEISARQSQETLFSRLAVVERFLEEESVIGSVDSPQAYFSDSMPLRWITLDEDRRDGPPQACVVFFGGETDETVLGLAGSASNVLGGLGPAAVSEGSMVPVIIRAFRNAVGDGPEAHPNSDRLLDLTLRTAAVSQAQGTQHQMTFLAKRLGEGQVAMDYASRFLSSGALVQRHLDTLAHDDEQGIHTVLGTPLFVALDE